MWAAPETELDTELFREGVLSRRRASFNLPTPLPPQHTLLAFLWELPTKKERVQQSGRESAADG